MSKRWRTRQRNAEKLERSRALRDRFYESVLSELHRVHTDLERSATLDELTAEAQRLGLYDSKGGAHE